MPIVNALISAGGSPVSADTTMELPIDVSTSGNDISAFNGDYTSTLADSTTGQTRGYKNDVYLVKDQDDNTDVVLSKAGTFPTGSFKSAVMSSTAVYLEPTKTDIVGTESKAGFDVSYTPAVEQETENFTRVGSPTITDGILGNLSGSNYLDFPGVNIGTADSWEIFTKVKTGSSTSSSYYILGGGDGKVCFDYGIAGNVWKFYLSSNGSSWNLASNINKNIQTSTSTWYYVKFYFTGTKYEMDVSTDGETWTNVAEFASTTKVYNCPTMRVGNSNDRSWPWKDYIDLNETYIKVNGEIVWIPISQPTDGDVTVGEGYGYVDEETPPFYLTDDVTKNATQIIVHSEDFTSSSTERVQQFTTTSAVPPIDSNGMASLFSSGSNKGIIADRAISNSFSTFEIATKIETSGSVSGGQIYLGAKDVSADAVALAVNNGKFRMWLSSNNSSFDITSGSDGSFSVQTYSTYYVKLVFDGSKYVFSYSTDGENYTDDIAVTSSTKIASFIPTLGSQVKGSSVNAAFSGGVYLYDTYIKTDNTIAWEPYGEKTVKEGNLFLSKPTSSTTTSVVAASPAPVLVKTKVYEAVGTSMTIVNDVASGFTSDSYVLVPVNYVLGFYDFEMVMHIKTGNLSSAGQGVGISNASNSQGEMRITLQDGSVIIGNHGSWGSHSCPTMVSNKHIWIKMTVKQSEGMKFYTSYNGSDYTLAFTDGSKFNTDALTEYVRLGHIVDDTPFAGSIYLRDFYIKLDGETVSAAYMKKPLDVESTPDSTYVGSTVEPLSLGKVVFTDPTLEKVQKVENTGIEDGVVYGLGTSVSGNDITMESGYYKSNNQSIYVGSDITKSLSQIGTGQTLGYKNDLYAYRDTSDVCSDLLCQTALTPVGSYKLTVTLPTNIYLDSTKTNILGTEASSGLAVSYEAASSIGSANFTINGSPTITDGVVSNFSTSNYLTFDGVGMGLANTWKIHLKVVTPSNTSSSYWLIDGNSNNVMAFGLSSGTWKIYLSSSGSSWNIASGAGNNVSVSTSTEYLIEFIFTGTKYIMNVSTDNGATWVEAASMSSSTKIYNASVMRIGLQHDSSWPWSTSIDLKDTYIEIDGEVAWKAYDGPTNGTITIGEGYSYIDEENSPFEVSADMTKTATQMVVHPEDFVVVGDEAVGYLFLAKPTDSTTLSVLSAQPNPTATYVGSTVDPLDMGKVVTLDGTLTKIISVEDSA